MATVEGGPVSSGLVNRVKSILLTPKVEWDVIAAEPATVKGLFTGYAALLAAIPPIASVIGTLLFGMGMFGVLGTGFLAPVIVGAAIQYVLSLVGVFVLGLVIEAMAPSFGGAKDQVQAMKVAVYSVTAVWIAGVLNIIPMLGALASFVGAIYCIYLLYLGLPKVMKAPDDKALGYTAVVIIVAIVIQVVISMLVRLIVGMAGLSALATGAAVASVYN